LVRAFCVAVNCQQMDKFHVFIIVYFVLSSAGSALVVRFTESNGGKLGYNITLAILCTELIKLVMASVLDRFWAGTTPGRPNANAVSASWVDWAHSLKQSSRADWQNYAWYALPSLIYAAANHFIIFSTNRLGPSMFVLLSNLKIVTTTLMTSLVLSKNFTNIQWIGVVMLLLSFFVAKVDLIMSDNGVGRAVDSAESQRFVEGVIGIVFLSLTSAAAAISNEYLIKKVDVDVSLMRKNIWMYQWGALLNFVYLVAGSYKQQFLVESDHVPSLFNGFGVAVVVLMVNNALLGLSVSMIMKYFDNVVKCFAGSLVVYLTATVSYFYWGEKTVNGPFVLSVMFFSLASYLYMGSHNEKLSKVELSEVLQQYCPGTSVASSPAVGDAETADGFEVVGKPDTTK